MMLNKSQLKDLVLASFEAEKNGDIQKNLTLLTDDFKYVDLTIDEIGPTKYFPSVGGQEARELMNTAFLIKNREFDFISVIADEKSQTVVVEFIESYLDEKTGKRFRTPQVAICKIKDKKIHRTRHYMDPRLSREYLSREILLEVYND